MPDEEKTLKTVAAPAAGKSPVEVQAQHGPALGKTFSALRGRNYRLFFAGQLISLIGTWMQIVAQAWLVYALTNSPLYLGIVSFASSIPALTLSLGAGVVIDRVPKRTLLIITQCAEMLLAFVLAVDVMTGWVQAWHVVILSFSLGIVDAFDVPARQAFVVEMVERREDLMNAIVLNSAIFNTARIIGPTLAGIALALVGAAWCFFLNGLSFIAVIIGLWLMDVKPMISAVRGVSPMTQMREGLGYIWRNQTVRTVISIVAVANLFGFGYSTLMPAFAEDVLNSGPAGLGFLSSAVGVGALTGALLLASLGNFRHKGMLITAGNLLFPIMALFFSASKIFPLSAMILVGVGLGFMVQNVTANTLIQVTVPDELRGRVMSVYTMVFQGFFPVGSLLAGFIAQNWGIPLGAAFGAGLSLLYSLFLLWHAPFLRKLA